MCKFTKYVNILRRFEELFVRCSELDYIKLQFTKLGLKNYNVKLVISEMFAFIVLQCTVSGRKSKHKADFTASHGIHLSLKK